MIEQFLMKDNFTYSLVIGTIILSVTAGYLLGSKDPAVVCAKHITEKEQLKIDKDKCDVDLTSCKAKGAGECALNCEPICDQQVKSALATKKEWVCDD
jgi:hypothetical protein